MSSVVIIGQGYVGLPLARAAASKGWSVHGLDLHQGLVDQLNSGKSHIDDLSDGDVLAMLEQGYRATTDPSVIASADVVVICVPTPLAEAGAPDLSAVEASARTVSGHLQKDTTVILESTTYPGTTQDLVVPLLQASGLKAGEDFHVCFSPERVNPGDPVYNITNTPKVVGGITAESTRRGSDFYASFIDVVVPVSGPREAEMSKLLENTYRHVNIALVNEMAKFCHELDIDIWEVIRAASTKPFGFQAFRPGPGVGGHCIPIDPNYLSHEVRKKLGYPFRFVELAQEINAGMPDYVASRIAGLLNEQAKPVNGSTVLLLGVTYKADIADQRESPALRVAELLRAARAAVQFHDPMVTSWELPGSRLARVENLDLAVQDADIVVLLQAHQSYDLNAMVTAANLFFDTRGASPAPARLL
jgi:UDP-N-acetyl-D-glucosamine dehydrogenase